MTNYTFTMHSDEEFVSKEYYPIREITMHVRDVEGREWTLLVNDFLDFLRGCGYVIPPQEVVECGNQ